MYYLFLPKYRTIKPFEIGANYIPTSIYVLCTYVVVKQISLVCSGGTVASRLWFVNEAIKIESISQLGICFVSQILYFS